MGLVTLSDLPVLQLADGITARAVNADSISVVHVALSAGAILPEHSHINEQIINVIEGLLQLEVEGTTHILEAGKVMVLAPNVPHAGKALTDVKVVDVFHPVREDFRAANFGGYPGSNDE